MTRIRISVAARALVTAEQLTISIRALGHHLVDVTCTIDETVASASHERPELIVLDASLCLEKQDAMLDAFETLGIPVLFVFDDDCIEAEFRPSDRGAWCLTMPFTLGQLEVAIEHTLGVTFPSPTRDVAALRDAMRVDIVEPLELVLASVERMSDLLTITGAAIDSCRDWIELQQLPGPIPAILSRPWPPGQLGAIDTALRDSFEVMLNLRRVLATAHHLSSEGGN